MTEEKSSRDLDLTLALLKSSFLIAECIRDSEPDSKSESGTKARMTNALAALTSNLAADDYAKSQSFDQVSLESLCGEWTSDEKYQLLLEMSLSEPFFPYQFNMNKSRNKKRLEQMGEISLRDLKLSRDSAKHVNAALKHVNNDYGSQLKTILSSVSLKDAAVVAGGAVVVAGVAIVAAPVIAAAMPAAAGLSGAAAVSAGLASLGGGSIAAGGLGMAGGMWALGTAGAAIGGVAGITTTVLGQDKGPEIIESSILKLCVNFKLAIDGHLHRDHQNFAKALDEIHESVIDAKREAEELNEKGSQRLKDFARLDRTLNFAGNYMAKNSAPTSESSPLVTDL